MADAEMSPGANSDEVPIAPVEDEYNADDKFKDWAPSEPESTVDPVPPGDDDN